MRKDIFKSNPFNPDVPKYCQQCGGRMVKGRRAVAASGRDPATGSIVTTQYKLKCEKITGFRLSRLLIQYHDDLLVIEDPSSKNATGKPHRTILRRSF